MLQKSHYGTQMTQIKQMNTDKCAIVRPFTTYQIPSSILLWLAKQTRSIRRLPSASWICFCLRVSRFPLRCAPWRCDHIGPRRLGYQCGSAGCGVPCRFLPDLYGCGRRLYCRSPRGAQCEKIAGNYLCGYVGAGFAGCSGAA